MRGVRGHVCRRMLFECGWGGEGQAMRAHPAPRRPATRLKMLLTTITFKASQHAAIKAASGRVVTSTGGTCMNSSVTGFRCLRPRSSKS